MIKIIIEKGDDVAMPVQRGQRTVREQSGYVLEDGKRHPTYIKFCLPEHVKGAYPVGEYTPAPSAFQVGKYDRLELNPWELDLIPYVETSKLKQVS